jgi:hypothetical protein
MLLGALGLEAVIGHHLLKRQLRAIRYVSVCPESRLCKVH